MGVVFEALQKTRTTVVPTALDWPVHEPPEAADRAEHAPTDDCSQRGATRPASGGEGRVAAPLSVGQVALDRADSRLVALADPAGILAEEYRGIRTRLLAGCANRPLVQTITSATRAEGKTITTLNLACVLGELDDRRTLVIEGDLRMPSFTKMLGRPRGVAPGLIQLLRGEAAPDDAVQTLHRPNLSVLYAGGCAAADALQWLSSPKWNQLLDELRRRFDHILIDTPPVLDVADAGVLGAASDDVILLVRMNHTPRKLVRQAVATLRGYEAPIAGVVLTDVQAHDSLYQYKYGYGGYSYGQDAGKAA